MPRRTIRVNYKVNYRVQIQRRITHRQQVQVTPIPVPTLSPQPLTSSRTMATSSPIRDIRRNAVEYAEQAGLPLDAEYDLFILHASDDQADLVTPLANTLRDEGLSVWYSEFVMKPGMSLRRSIDAGLSKCEWGVVVVSPHFFRKPWPNYELGGLVTRSMVKNRQLILPLDGQTIDCELRCLAGLVGDDKAVANRAIVLALGRALCIVVCCINALLPTPSGR